MYELVFLIVSVLEVFLYIIISQNRSRTRQALVFVLIALSNFGYFALSLSKCIEEAILAQKITYIGGVFLPYLIYLNIEDILGILRKRVEVLLGLFCTIYYSLICTIGYYTLYYKEVDIKITTFGTELVRIYGKLYGIKFVFLFTVLLCCISLLSKSSKDKRRVSRYSINFIMFMLIVTSLLFIVGGIGLFGNIEYTPIIYTFCGTCFLFLSIKVQLYDLSSSIKSIVNNLNNLGYIILDAEFEYMTSNKYAQCVFPVLQSCVIDEPIKGSTYIDEIITWYKENGSAPLLFRLGNEWLECTVVKEDYGIASVYIIEIYNKTNEYKLIEITQNYAKTLHKEVVKKTSYLNNIQNGIVVGIAALVESRDSSTGGHIKRTSVGVKCFIERLKKNYNMDNKYWENIIRAAPLHDIGKIAIDDDILKKPGKFTEAEYDVMKEHAQNGADLLKEVLKDINDTDFVNIAVNIANYHHEKFNGGGYPKGLKGAEIPFEARIMALVDVFDALVSRRCYKEAFTFDKAFSIIKNESGSHFDPDLCKIFLQCRYDLEELYKSLEE